MRIQLLLGLVEAHHSQLLRHWGQILSVGSRIQQHTHGGIITEIWVIRSKRKNSKQRFKESAIFPTKKNDLADQVAKVG